MPKVRLSGGKPIMIGRKVALSDNCCCNATGACCISGICAEGYTEADCITAGGTFQGSGTTCGPPDPCQSGACCKVDNTCITGSNYTDCTAISGTYLGNGSTCSGVDCTCCPLFDPWTQVIFSGQVLGCTGGTINLPQKTWTKTDPVVCTLAEYEFAHHTSCLCTFQARNCFPFTEVDYVAVDEIGDCTDPNSYFGCLLLAHIACNGSVIFEGGTGPPQCCDVGAAISPTGGYDLTAGALDVTLNSDSGDPSIQFRFILSLA